MNTTSVSSAANQPSHQKTPTISVPEQGCYVPAITFFDPDTDRICPWAQAKYYSYLASTGLKGLVVLGTNAETFLLTRDERKALLRIARSAVPENYPIIAGVSGHSLAQVLEFIRDAYEEGANYALLLPCAYFGKQTTLSVVKNFFIEVAAVSPLPIIIYNFPAVCNGLDLDSETITEIARQSPSVVGVKLTCGSVAKISRLTATFPSNRFAVFGGQADFLVGGLAAGSAGCIAAFANVFPRTIARIFDLWTKGHQEQAMTLQGKAALAESPTKAGIANTKYAAAIFTAPKAGIDGAIPLLRPRKPYEEPSEAAKKLIQERMALLNQEEMETVPPRQIRL